MKRTTKQELENYRELNWSYSGFRWSLCCRFCCCCYCSLSSTFAAKSLMRQRIDWAEPQVQKTSSFWCAVVFVTCASQALCCCNEDVRRFPFSSSVCAAHLSSSVRWRNGTEALEKLATFKCAHVDNQIVHGDARARAWFVCRRRRRCRFRCGILLASFLSVAFFFGFVSGFFLFFSRCRISCRFVPCISGGGKNKRYCI